MDFREANCINPKFYLGISEVGKEELGKCSNSLTDLMVGNSACTEERQKWQQDSNLVKLLNWLNLDGRGILKVESVGGPIKYKCTVVACTVIIEETASIEMLHREEEQES